MVSVYLNDVLLCDSQGDARYSSALIKLLSIINSRKYKYVATGMMLLLRSMGCANERTFK